MTVCWLLPGAIPVRTPGAMASMGTPPSAGHDLHWRQLLLITPHSGMPSGMGDTHVSCH